MSTTSSDTGIDSPSKVNLYTITQLPGVKMRTFPTSCWNQGISHQACNNTRRAVGLCRSEESKVLSDVQALRRHEDAFVQNVQSSECIHQTIHEG
jgi:hypothetical protein